MSQRFYSAEPIAGDRTRLVDAEAHHLARVLRAKPGHVVTLFDGSGVEFEARIERIGKRDVELAIVQRRAIDRELPFLLTLAVALPKGERQRWLVEKAVELGVARVVPLITTRGVAEPAAAIDRLRRAVVEATKQCGRNRLMEIAPAQSCREVFERSLEATMLRWFAHVAASDRGADREQSYRIASRPNEVIAAIGPEGGWTDEEANLARAANWQTIQLGARILRVETAALAIAAIAANRFT